MLRKSAAALVSLILVSQPIGAGDGNGILWGAGIDSCGSWAEERKSNAWYTKGQWMLGFVSAVSVFDVLDLKKTDAQAFAGFVDNYCREHPIDQFSDAVRALLAELQTQRPDKQQ